MRLLLVKTPTVIITASLLLGIVLLAAFYLFPLAILLGVSLGGGY